MPDGQRALVNSIVGAGGYDPVSRPEGHGVRAVIERESCTRTPLQGVVQNGFAPESCTRTLSQEVVPLAPAGETVYAYREADCIVSSQHKKERSLWTRRISGIPPWVSISIEPRSTASIGRCWPWLAACGKRCGIPRRRRIRGCRRPGRLRRCARARWAAACC